jgi:5-methylcytosine-specific restriction enzyme subunit McrC
MVTDISIQWPDRYLIIDTKFYKQALQRHYEKESIHSNNLYQIFSYLRNFAQQNPEYENCEGMLLYPTVETEEIRSTLKISSRASKIATKSLEHSSRRVVVSVGLKMYH